MTPTSIIDASSLTVTNSVSFSVLLSLRSAFASALSFSCTASRFSLRYLAPFLFCVCFEVRRAKVSFTCLATSSSLTSSGFWLRLRFFFFFPCPFAGLAAAEPGCAAAAISTRSLILARFFLSPFCCAFSSRSLRFSSFDFFFGRVLWLRASRSIFPRTFTFGALSIFFSLLSWNTFG